MRQGREVRNLLSAMIVVVLCSGPVWNCDCGHDIGGRPEMVVDKTVLQFEEVAVGYPQTRTLAIDSVGRVGIVFDKLEVRGGADSPFAVLGMLDANGEVVELPGSVGPGQGIEVVVQYDPATEDADDFDTLDIVTNDKDPCPSEYNQCEIQLNGTGAPPDAELDVVCQQDETCPLGETPVCRIILDDTNTHPVRVSLNFCEVVPGQNSQLDVLLRNIGNIPLTMSGLELDESSSEDYSLLAPEQVDIELAPGADQMLSVNYAPLERGPDSGGMEVETNDEDLIWGGYPPGTFSLRLLGQSNEPDIDVNPTNIPFSDVVQGEQASETVRISNTGQAVLVIDAIEVTGGSVEGEFSIDQPGPLEIPAAGDESFQVTYAPQDVGADDGSVLIHSNDPDEAIVTVTLGGEVRPDIDVTPQSVVEFIDVPPGESETQDVTIRNVGYADLTVETLGFSTNPGDPQVFELEGLPADYPAQPIVLAPAESLTFQVRFTDNTMIENEVGQLDIFHDSPSDNNPYPLLLASTGTPANLPPVAVVEPSTQVVHGFDSIELSAASSFDPDAGDSVASYNWSFLFKPQDAQGNQSQATLDSSDQVTTSFTPDIAGEYVIRLVVFDTFNAASTPADAEVSVNR